MTRKIFSLTLFVLFIWSTTQITINISGNKTIKQNDELHLNCSSEIRPSRTAADIQINGISFTSLTLLNGDCFSRKLRTKCSPDICSCSKDGIWFSHIYKAIQPEGNITVSCSMIFETIGTITERIQVRIIDLPDPEITTDPALPIPVGSDVKLSCLVSSKNTNIQFEWSCFKNITVIGNNVHRHNLTFSTFLVRNVNLKHDNQRCTCRVSVQSVSAKYSVRLRISTIGKPIVKTEKTIHCNSSSIATLTCQIRTEQQAYGFHSWIHSFNGVRVRTLNGTTVSKESILKIDSCRYDDAGEYTCVAWNMYDETKYTANASVNMIVYDSPVIVSSRVFREQKTTFSVLFYSTSQTLCLWQQMNESLINSTQLFQTVDRITIDVKFYNETIKCDGYMANLSISLPSGKYKLVLQNDYGESKYCFGQYMIISKDVASSFSLWILVFALISIGIFKLTAVGTTILAKGRHCNNVIHIVGPHDRCPTIPIYHSAPASSDLPNMYDIPETLYLEVIDNSYELCDYSEVENDENEDRMPINAQGDYEEIE